MATKPAYDLKFAADSGIEDAKEPTIELKQFGVQAGKPWGREHLNWMFKGVGNWVDWIRAYAMDRENNLSEITNREAARTNLGLNDPTVTLNANISTAEKFRSNKNIAITGDVEGNTSTAFSGNTSINVLLKNVVSAGAKTKPVVNAKGLVVGNEALVAADIPNLPASKITSGTLSVGTTGNATTATRLQNSVNIRVGGTTRSFNGSAGISFDLNQSDIPDLPANKITSGTLSVGTSGNAATATKLQTARTITIAGTSKAFDGTQNISFSLNEISPFPAGTRLLFQQTNAPTGWTKVITHNDAALRVVNAGVSSGGSTGFSAAFNSNQNVSVTVQNHALTISQIPSHSHKIPQPDGNYPAGETLKANQGGENNSSNAWRWGGSSNLRDITAYTQAVGGSQGHNHGASGSVNFNVKYVDVIIAEKN